MIGNIITTQIDGFNLHDKGNNDYLLVVDKNKVNTGIFNLDNKYINNAFEYEDNKAELDIPNLKVRNDVYYRMLLLTADDNVGLGLLYVKNKDILCCSYILSDVSTKDISKTFKGLIANQDGYSLDEHMQVLSFMGFSSYMFKGSELYLHRYFNGYGEFVYSINRDTQEIKTYVEIYWCECRDRIHKIKILYSFDDNTIKLYNTLSDYIELEQELLTIDDNNISLGDYSLVDGLKGDILTITLKDGSIIELDLSEYFKGTTIY